MNLRELRDAIAAERTKLPQVDGRPLDPAPAGPAQVAPAPGTPAPDPSQGVRGGQALPPPDPAALPRGQQTAARISQSRDDQLADMRRRGYKGGYPGTRWHIDGPDAA